MAEETKPVEEVAEATVETPAVEAPKLKSLKLKRLKLKKKLRRRSRNVRKTFLLLLKATKKKTLSRSAV